jgi:ssDNA-binding Zn-finger/Zn-ribbon topoisomerase 1
MSEDIFDQDMKEVADELLKPDEYEIELYLSTDGKHTVHYKAQTPEGRKKGLNVAMILFDAIKKKYGTKADMWGEAMKNGKKEEPKEVKTQGCPKCGGTRTFREGVSAKTGKRWAGWFCSNTECKPEFINLASVV